MLATFLQVALGGAIGAAARYASQTALLRLPGPGFPVAILIINILGSFLMGVFVVWSAQKEMAGLNPLVRTGMLGGFTTFSMFSLEAFTLLERGQYGSAAFYIVVSVALPLASLALGVWIARGLWA